MSSITNGWVREIDADGNPYYYCPYCERLEFSGHEPSCPRYVAPAEPTVGHVMLAGIDEVVPDDANANRHTKRGEKMLRASVRKFKPRGAGTVDRNCRVVHGNSRRAVFEEAGYDSVEIVDADPSIPVFVRYGDLDLDDPATRELSIALNRTEEVGIDLDPAAVLDVAGVRDLSYMFTPQEMNLLRGAREHAPVERQAAVTPCLRLLLPVAVYEDWLRLLHQAPGESDEARASAILLAMSSV